MRNDEPRGFSRDCRPARTRAGHRLRAAVASSIFEDRGFSGCHTEGFKKMLLASRIDRVVV
jgi:hypothetical protein